MPYEITDKLLKLAVPIGEHTIHSGNGKLARKRDDIVGGTHIETTAQLAFARGVLHSIVKMTYDGTDIPAERRHFFKGAPGEVGVDSFFPQDINHPGFSHVNFSLMKRSRKTRIYRRSSLASNVWSFPTTTRRVSRWDIATHLTRRVPLLTPPNYLRAIRASSTSARGLNIKRGAMQKFRSSKTIKLFTLIDLQLTPGLRRLFRSARF